MRTQPVRSAVSLAGRATVGMLAVAAMACSDPRTAPPRGVLGGATLDRGESGEDGALRVSDVTASVAWNEAARNYVAGLAVKPSQQANLRGFAYLSLAQYNAAIAAEKRGGEDEEEGKRASPQAAVAGASAVVLSYLFPAGAGAFEAAVRAQADRASSPGEDHTDFAMGEAIGRAVGAAVVASAKTDRFDAVWMGTVPVGPGLWTGTAPLLPLLGQMRTFFMTSGSQFRPPPPPAFGSAEYLAALAEVRHVSDTRTPEQLAIAQFWAMTTGTLVAGFWNAQVSDLVTRYHLDERRAAHILALSNMAAMDGNIACHDGKYTYWLIRPWQADPAITTPIGRPNHPSYPSNHACQSGTFAYVVGGLLPAERARLVAMADQAGESRIFAGIHYRFDKNAGLRIARQVAHLALERDVHGHEPFPIR